MENQIQTKDANKNNIITTSTPLKGSLVLMGKVPGIMLRGWRLRAISLLLLPFLAFSQNANSIYPPEFFSGLEYRSVGPTRGGRATAIAGIPEHPHTFFFGATGGGVWKSDDAGTTWNNISDGQIEAGSIGAITIAPSDENTIYVGAGSAYPRVFTNHIGRLYSVLISDHHRPTGSVLERYEDLKKEYAGIVADYEQVMREAVPKFNEWLEREKVGRLILPEKIR